MLTRTSILGKGCQGVTVSLGHYFHLCMDVGINADQWDTKGNTRGATGFYRSIKFKRKNLVITS